MAPRLLISLRRKRMKIGLYLQDSGTRFGGAEFWLACLAEAWSRHHSVVALLHKSVALDDLARFSGQRLSRVMVRRLSGTPIFWPDTRCGLEVTRASAEFDLFVAITHFVPPKCLARHGCLIVLYPMECKSDHWPWSEKTPHGARAAVRAWYYERLWQQRFGSYNTIVALSEFARRGVMDRWQVQAEVNYPPVDLVPPARKRQTIVSVGRFAGNGVSKRQLEMVEAFLKHVHSEVPSWRFDCIGALGSEEYDRQYFRRLQIALRATAEDAVHLRVNLARVDVRQALGEASILWHAAGLGQDETVSPELCEHFGLVVVDAMSAGCVPVVIGKGGLREIVEHGVSGFLCSTLDEVAASSIRLINNPDLLDRMSAASRERARFFSKERSIARLERLLGERGGLDLQPSGE